MSDVVVATLVDYGFYLQIVRSTFRNGFHFLDVELPQPNLVDENVSRLPEDIRAQIYEVKSLANIQKYIYKSVGELKRLTARFPGNEVVLVLFNERIRLYVEASLRTERKIAEAAAAIQDIHSLIDEDWTNFQDD